MVGKKRQIRAGRLGGPTRKFLLRTGPTGFKKLVVTRLPSKDLNKIKKEARKKGAKIETISAKRAERIIKTKIAPSIGRKKGKLIGVRTFGRKGTKDRSVAIDIPKTKKRRSI